MPVSNPNPTTAIPARIRHDDYVAQRALVERLRAEPFTGMPRKLPKITRPKPAPQEPAPILFACLPRAARPPKPATLPIAVARPAEPATDTFTAEELAEIESFFARSTLDTAAVKRWDAWISGDRSAHREIMRLPGVDGLVDIETIETRLGWGARVNFANKRDHLAHGSLSRPDYEKGEWFYWGTRDAAVAYCASRIWLTASDTEGYGVRKERHFRLLAAEMKSFLGKVGIDVAVPPPASLRRVLVTEARRRELKAGAPPALASVPAATTPPPAQTPAAPKHEAAEEQPQPPRIETDRKRTLAQVVAGAGGLSMREPTLPDRMEIHAAIGEALPPGVPTYVRDIVAVNRAPGQKGGRIIADLRLFDGAVGRIEISGQPGGRGYRWHSSGIERTAFHWDERARSWVRVPEPE